MYIFCRCSRGCYGVHDFFIRCPSWGIDSLCVEIWMDTYICHDIWHICIIITSETYILRWLFIYIRHRNSAKTVVSIVLLGDGGRGWGGGETCRIRSSRRLRMVHWYVLAYLLNIFSREYMNIFTPLTPICLTLISLTPTPLNPTCSNFP
jgi:hypothetical protein